MRILARAAQLLALTAVLGWCLIWYGWIVLVLGIIIFAGIVPTLFDILNGGI